MKVLFTLVPALDPNGGGVQASTYKIGKFLHERKMNVSYFSFERVGHSETQFGDLYHSNFDNGIYNKNNLDQLYEVIKNIQPDIVINQMPYADPLRKTLTLAKNEVHFLLIGCLRNSLFNFKSNIRERMKAFLPAMVFKLMDNRAGYYFFERRHWIKHRFKLRSIIKDHDYFVLLAPPNREELEYFLPNYDENKVITIPNSIPGVKDILPPKEKIILHVGRLNIQQKRSDLLLEFWKLTSHKLPDWKFIIVGDGPYKRNMESRIKDEKIPNVQLEGYQNPDSYYSKASIFVMPSAYEGFPNTLIEAQSFGCFPIAFNSYGAIRWIVNNKKDALLISPFDVVRMSEEVVNVVKNNEVLSNLQGESIENARRFTIDKVGNIWLNQFERMTNFNG